MNGKINLILGARPINSNQLDTVIAAVQNKISELQAQFPNLQITASGFTWSEE